MMKIWHKKTGNLLKVIYLVSTEKSQRQLTHSGKLATLYYIHLKLGRKHTHIVNNSYKC